MNTYLVTAHAMLSALCWIVVASGATFAVFSKAVRDTTAERFGLAAIAVGASGTACRIIYQGWITDGGLFLSAGFAFYVCAVFWKHWKGDPSRTPADKTRPGELL